MAREKASWVNLKKDKHRYKMFGKKITSLFKKNRKTDLSTSKSDLKSDNEAYEASDISEAINQAFDNKDENVNYNTKEFKNSENKQIEEKNDGFFIDFFLNNPSSIFLFLIVSIFLGAGFWATFTELDEVIRCNGQVVPASNAKIVQIWVSR